MAKKDDERQVAFDLSAPPVERYDAQRQLAKSHMPLASALLPAENIMPVIDWINNDLAEQALMKSRSTNVIPFPQAAKGKRGMQSVYLDDLQIWAQGEYFEKPSPLGFDSLRMMVEQTPILNAVIMTRIRQVSRFCQPQQGDGPGFSVCHAEQGHKPSAEETQSMKLLTKFFKNCGWEFDPRRRKRLKRDNFTQFMAKHVRDSLTMDSAPIETEMKKDKRLGIDGFYAVDGATIRLCAEDGYQGDDEIYAVQVTNGLIRTAYTYDDLIYEPRNPRTDVRLAGYGLGETELLVRVVTGFLNALTYNIKGFDDNAIPKGLLHLSGDYSTEDLAAFKRYWNATVKGINNAWTLPVMVSKDQESKASFEKFGVDYNEMYFAKWMTFLTSIICAIYGMGPDEINFEAFAAGSSAGLGGNDTVEKLAASKDKGLRPLLSHAESLMTDYITSAFSDKYAFRFEGLDPEDADKRHEMKKLTQTLDEARAEEGLDPWDGPLGGAPLNPSLIGPWMQAQQAASQDFGTPDAGEPPAAGAAGDMPPKDEPANKAAPENRPGDFGKAFVKIYTIES